MSLSQQAASLAHEYQFLAADHHAGARAGSPDPGAAQRLTSQAAGRSNSSTE
ncbi:hypothetical protein [Pseudomonas sp. KCJK8993]|uniref:hypothetical protein n=1 Tax=Pseudomonas sp. KCJK8993 TaxID=3344565 RepID=UPI003906823B